MRRKCLRHIDTPISLSFGVGSVDVDDLPLIVVVFGFLMFFMSGGKAMIGAVLFTVLLRRIKRGKPYGYVFHRIYRLRLHLLGLKDFPVGSKYVVQCPSADGDLYPWKGKGAWWG